MNKNKKIAKKVLTAVLAASMVMTTGTSVFAAGAVKSDEVSEREERNAELSMNLATQGMVLLENKDQALPIAKEGNIAVFGAGAAGTIKGGTGSGDVNQRYTVSVAEGFERAGYNVTTGDYIEAYKAHEEEVLAASTSWWGRPAVLDIDLEDAWVETAKQDTDTAIYVLARNSGEGSDRAAAEGDYYLNETEKANIVKLTENFEKVIVVLNVGGIIDTKFIDEIEGIDAVLLMSQAGMRGGDAVVKVLNGEVTPSGKLTDTWAVNYEDYPSSETFSTNDGNDKQEDYTDGIYVGYRYFDTFGVAPAYEFGYGLSYTTFDTVVDSVTADADRVTVTATVTNTGDTYSGKEVVQVYFSAPDGTLEKPYQELAAFAKTDELAPGESQTLTITYLTTEMSAYSEEKAAYIMEPGDYVVRVGNSSRNTKAAAVITLDEEAITEQLSNQVVADKELEMLSKAGATPYTYEGEADEIAAAEKIALAAADIKTVNNASPYDDESVTAYVSDTTETEYLAENLGYEPTSKYHGAYEEKVEKLEGDFSQSTLKDVYDGTITMEEFVSGLTVSQMADIVIGGNKLPNANGQSAGAASANADGVGEGAMVGAQANAVSGAAGETAGIYIESKKIPNIVLADGPAGLRITKEEEREDGTYYQFCTAWPIGTLLAQSWDTEVVRAMGAGVGEELKEYGVTLWLAPGLNIHRNPLCGRNFEYYSEDPYLVGAIGMAETAGIQSNAGIGVTIKHYAGNQQENSRTTENNTITERTFREINLKGFEMIVKGAKPMAIMTSYNLNNSVPAADDYDLCTDLARGEWGFDGLIMTDWGGGQSTPSISMHAGNDLIMPGSSVEDITIRGFCDQEPTFGEDDIYPAVTVGQGWFGPQASTAWGEFVLDPAGDTVITKTVKTEDYEAAVRPTIKDGAEAEVAVSELIAQLGDAVEVVANEDGTTTINYKGSYKDNNICLGDLQKATANILTIVMQSNQFANLFDDVETVSYTDARADQLTIYSAVEKSEITK
ncbi:MAG: glycoside hydrolase family 3 C-terminal domain-containing protein [Lachnospiraceae bacterium]|nr:glycoside hydrolase family 3 C-terminal domain-containing protein [Robinsoniella sp.]MDY3765510.1 glycoside hydrolase family 3 C-terminal domain-containing protein [Lachnospiraceae bacterium]